MTPAPSVSPVPDTELGSHERELLAAYRDHHAMPAASRARVWASLAGGPAGGGGSAIESAPEAWVRAAGPVVASGWSRPVRVAAAGLVVAAGITLIVLGVARSREDRRAPIAIVEPSTAVPVLPTPEPVQVVVPRSEPLVSRPAPHADAAQVVTIEPTAQPRIAAPRARARTPQPEQPIVVSSLGRERELIEQAHAALAKGDNEAALAALDEHARSFADGVFAEERAGLDAITRCKADQRELGRARAQAFLDRHPQAVLAARVRRTCDIEGSTSEAP